MNYMANLYRTYEALHDEIGQDSASGKAPLLPVGHTTQLADILIVLDGEGSFQSARVLDAQERRTIIPCTEASSSRTSGKVAHPLCDKLEYIAGDYAKYTGKKSHNNLFLKEIDGWATSEAGQGSAVLQAVRKYVHRGGLIADLVGCGVLFVGGDGKLIDKWTAGKEKPPIFKHNIAASDSFVCFAIQLAGQPQTLLSKNRELWDLWAAYRTSQMTDKDVCYLSGNEGLVSRLNPKKIRNDGDGAKLISTNDASGFVYRGRFTEDKQVFAIGDDVSQKAHMMLRYLIARQGFQLGDLAILSWATNGVPVPQPYADTSTTMHGDYALEEAVELEPTSAPELAVILNKLTAGYRQRIPETEGLSVIMLDSATPGRMSVSYYRDLPRAEYFSNLCRWHEEAAWKHEYMTSGERRGFYGAPSLRDIGKAAYGNGADSKVMMNCVKRVLPCVIDAVPFPSDIANCIYVNASRRGALEPWEWSKTLTIACGLYRFQHKEEGFQMALDQDRATRDYLYGRLLAVADAAEEYAIYVNKDKPRPTNAARYMQRFASAPCATWCLLRNQVEPYLQRLGKRGRWCETEMDQIMAMFRPEDFVDNSKLGAEYLLGFHCERLHLREAAPKKDNNAKEENDHEQD